MAIIHQLKMQTFVEEFNVLLDFLNLCDLIINGFLQYFYIL